MRNKKPGLKQRLIAVMVARGFCTATRFKGSVREILRKQLTYHGLHALYTALPPGPYELAGALAEHGHKAVAIAMASDGDPHSDHALIRATGGDPYYSSTHAPALALVNDLIDKDPDWIVCAMEHRARKEGVMS